MNPQASDTFRLKAIHEIATNQLFINPDSAIELANLELQFAIDKKNKEYQQKSLYILKIGYFNKANKINNDSLKSREERLLQNQRELDKINESRRLGQNFGLGGALFGAIFVAWSFYYNDRKRKKLNEQLTIEKKKSDELLLNILPADTADELKQTGKVGTKRFDQVTVMFTDFKNFTTAAEKMTPEELVDEINFCYSEFDRIISKHGVEKIKTIGDSYMCAGGLPVVNDSHAQNVIQAALDIQKFMVQHKTERESNQLPFFETKIGIHSGPVVAGIIGIKKFAYDIWGDTVNIASRMESSGESGKVNISGTTFSLVKDKFNCSFRGKIQAKNKGEIEMYFVDSYKSDN
jgi:class 3 adenylate cyclase